MTFKEKIMLAQKIIFLFLLIWLIIKILLGYIKYLVKKMKDAHAFILGNQPILHIDCLVQGGYIYMYLNNNLSKLVPCIIDKYIKDGYKIEIEIIKVEYKDTSFSRAAHRLALAEISEIVKYQREGQCLEQMPEGVGMNEEKFWEENYKIEEINSSF